MTRCLPLNYPKCAEQDPRVWGPQKLCQKLCRTTTKPTPRRSMKLTVAIVGVVVMCWTASAAYPNPVPQTTHRLVGNLSSVSTSAPLRHPTFLDGMAHDVDMRGVIIRLFHHCRESESHEG